MDCCLFLRPPLVCPHQHACDLLPSSLLSLPTLEGQAHAMSSSCYFLVCSHTCTKEIRNGDKTRLHLGKSAPLEPWVKQYDSSHLKRVISNIPALRNCSESLYAMLHAWKKQGSAGDTHCLPSSEHQLWLSSVG